MASELERLKALIKAEVATKDDMTRYLELGGDVTQDEVAKFAEAGVDVEAALAKAQTEASPAPAVAQAGAIDFEDEVDIDKFKEGGEQFYMPSEPGFYKSKLIDVVKPSYSDKDLKIFTFETDDEKLKSQGRGAIFVELSKGSFSLKTILDGIGVPYTIVGNSRVKYSIVFPHPCYANWTVDPKGKASGNVLITGLRTLEAGSQVEKAI